MLGAVEQLNSRQQPVETQPGLVAEQDSHAPGFIAQPNPPMWQRLQAGRQAGRGVAVVKQGQLPRRLEAGHLAGQYLAVAPQAGATMHRRGDIHVNQGVLPKLDKNPVGLNIDLAR